MKLLLHIDWAFFNPIPFEPLTREEGDKQHEVYASTTAWGRAQSNRPGLRADLEKLREGTIDPECFFRNLDTAGVKLRDAELRLTDTNTPVAKYMAAQYNSASRTLVSCGSPGQPKAFMPREKSLRCLPHWFKEFGALARGRGYRDVKLLLNPNHVAPYSTSGYISRRLHVSGETWCRNDDAEDLPWGFKILRQVRFVDAICVSKSVWDTPPWRDDDFRRFVVGLSSRTKTSASSFDGNPLYIRGA